jgi:aerobic-type carbon monoxide dehydrogenase small subunit (CoxS/CutS family)
MIQLKVNGVEQAFGGETEMPLLWYLRDALGIRRWKENLQVKE